MLNLYLSYTTVVPQIGETKIIYTELGQKHLILDMQVEKYSIYAFRKSSTASTKF